MKDQMRDHSESDIHILGWNAYQAQQAQQAGLRKSDGEIPMLHEKIANLARDVINLSEIHGQQINFLNARITALEKKNI